MKETKLQRKKRKEFIYCELIFNWRKRPPTVKKLLKQRWKQFNQTPSVKKKKKKKIEKNKARRIRQTNLGIKKTKRKNWKRKFAEFVKKKMC